MRGRRLMGLLGMAVVGLAVACSGSDSGPTGPGGNAQTVNITGFKFVPDTLTISVGTTVTWKNNDTAPHTATADAGAFASANLAKDETFTRTFSAAGTFPYHCAVHPTMKGTVKVQ